MGSVGTLGRTLILLSIIFLGIGSYELVRASIALNDATNALRKLPEPQKSQFAQLALQQQEALAYEAFTLAFIVTTGIFAGYLGIHSDNLRGDIDGLSERVEQSVKKHTPGTPLGWVPPRPIRAASETETMKNPWSDEMEARRKAAEEKSGADVSDSLKRYNSWSGWVPSQWAIVCDGVNAPEKSHYAQDFRARNTGRRLEQTSEEEPLTCVSGHALRPRRPNVAGAYSYSTRATDTNMRERTDYRTVT